MSDEGTRMGLTVLALTIILTLGDPAEAATLAYLDQPFLQDYSEKIPPAPQLGAVKLQKVRMDRNGQILVLSDKGLLQVDAGLLKPDHRYRPLTDAVVKDIEVNQGEFIYLTDHEVVSNAGAGRLLAKHQVFDATQPARDPNSFESRGQRGNKLPCRDIRCTRTIGDSTWFGTPKGAFALHPDGHVDYYASKRWLIDDAVVDLWPGLGRSVLVLSETGLSIIHFREMTLADKAAHFDKLTRQRHIRYGFSSSLAMSMPGDLSSGTRIDSDNDGLWTAMYLAGELFRYGVTKSGEALRNCYESFEAMERLCQITGIKGFPARSFERTGYEVSDKSRWHTAEDKRWVWKGTTSSDEIVGHFFAYAIFAEIVPDEAWRRRAITLTDDIMDHIVRNNWYLIDADGKPTQWGRWHPEYVNRFPRQVGDRRLNSVEIIAFLQTAYHFTGKDLYKQKALELLHDQGYLDNILIPLKDVSRVPGINLTTEWNHSDDELAFLSYWNLYRYALTPQLREQYRQAIRDHWEIERPEKNPLWNFIYAATGAEEFDLKEAIWSLKEFPLDTISWTVRNSQRQDLQTVPHNFRGQSTTAVLPPDERPMSKYNGNAFRLDDGDGGHEEFSGDIYLLPYWMGRYLRVIGGS
jgi:hypothetical protein